MADKRKIGIFLTNLRWHLRIFGLHARLRLAGVSSERKHRAYLEHQCLREKELYLLRLLRKVPYWASGHATLGILLAEQLRCGEGRIEVRTVRRVGVSARASAQLAQGERAEVDSLLNFLLGTEAFFLRDYKIAISELGKLEHDLKFSSHYPALIDIAREYLGGALMAVGDNSQAKRVFETIPESRRTTEIREALSFLRNN